MKAVLISIKPKYCKLIVSGKKTVEVRKTKPKIDTPFKCYIYETKTPLRWNKAHNNIIGGEGGYIIGEFVCDKIIVAECGNYAVLPKNKTMVDELDLLDYADEKTIYGWHISNLVIYDEPRMLHHFFKPCGDCSKKGTRRCTEELTDCRAKVITRPPQSWCYVEEGKTKNEYI